MALVFPQPYVSDTPDIVPGWTVQNLDNGSNQGLTATGMLVSFGNGVYGECIYQ